MWVPRSGQLVLQFLVYSTSASKKICWTVQKPIGFFAKGLFHGYMQTPFQQEM
jgi:hypothetical protein